MHKAAIHGAMLCVLLALAACAPAERVEIGAALALTGEAAEFGQDELRAVELAVAQANAEGGIDGRPIRLIVEDTKTSNTGTLTAVRKLISVDAVPAIVGPTYGDSFGEIVAPLGEEHGVVQITPSGALEVVPEAERYAYYFSTWYPQDEEIARQLDFLEDRNLERVVVVHDQDAFNSGFSDRFVSHALERGLSVEGRFEIPIETLDFRTVLLKAQLHEPDAIVVMIYDVAKLATVTRNAQELGIGAIVLSTASTQVDVLLEQGGYLDDRLYYSYPDLGSARFAAFEREFEAAYGEPPIAASAAPAYDAARAIITAMRSGASTGPQIRDALRGLEMEGTGFVAVSFTEMGQVASAPFLIKTIRSGEFVVVG